MAVVASSVNAIITNKGKYTSSVKTEAQKVAEIKQRMSESNQVTPTQLWFDANIDHYDNHGAGSPTYPMRYLIDETYFNKETGPIIFYAGNEGDVWTFWDNSGFMTTTLAQEFGALVVFGEHRYFGESMPFGDQTFDRKNLKYLTVEQAMFDYVELIKMIKETKGI